MSDYIAADRNQSLRSERLLTVVIPHFNQKDFLPRAVASVLKGESREIEIIIVDDGSTDDSEPVLAALEVLDPCITIIRGKTNSCMEIGHIQVIPDGPLCGCGLRGCLEAVASRLAISAAVRAGAISSSVSSPSTLAASRVSWAWPWRPASTMSIMNGVHCQIITTITDP